MVGPSREVGAGGGEFPLSRAKRGSFETIGTLFCIENTYIDTHTHLSRRFTANGPLAEFAWLFCVRAELATTNYIVT